MMRAALPFYPLTKGRTHEVCGAGAYGFAFALAAKIGGNFLWIKEAWEAQQLNPNGIAAFLDPAHLLQCSTKDQMESLATAEEALRSGALPLVVIALHKPIGLTEGRRLQLAARDGKSVGLTLIPEGMGSNAAETRWRCSPAFEHTAFAAQDSTLQTWELIKNKSGTLGIWYVRWNTASRHLDLVSASRE
ncbi:MAG: hypothetical protein JXQ85_15320 [Cognatishimia sp.]|uniref:ImuA family protein n=1 Tax=Cognatishimia sp. TaxID=2211648 RepID=UPI003B8D38B7